jgi:hypothetical protein
MVGRVVVLGGEVAAKGQTRESRPELAGKQVFDRLGHRDDRLAGPEHEEL